MSLGARRSDAPCGESIAGPTWLAICFNADWLDWWKTAVFFRGQVIEEMKSRPPSVATAEWLKSWADDPIGRAASVFDANWSGKSALWKSNPGLVWSKSRLMDLVGYSLQGAELLGKTIEAEDADSPVRSLKPLLYGLGAGVVIVGGLVLYLK